jgi:hypothetical protein
MLKRHEVEILHRASHLKTEAARLAGVSVRSVHRIAEEAPAAFPQTAHRDSGTAGGPTFSGNSSASSRGSLARSQNVPVRAGGLAAPERRRERLRKTYLFGAWSGVQGGPTVSVEPDIADLWTPAVGSPKWSLDEASLRPKQDSRAALDPDWLRGFWP